MDWKAWRGAPLDVKVKALLAHLRRWWVRRGLPRVVLYRAANPIPFVVWNTYREVLTPRGVGKTIGMGFRVGRRQPRNHCLSIVWRKP